MGKILLFYKYIAIRYPLQIQKWQRRLCESLNLTGRIIIASEGINGTVGGTPDAIEKYRHEILAHPLFTDMDIKESAGSAADFPRLNVVIKNEIVHLGIDPQELPASAGGIHLTPAQAHALIADNPEDLIILDGRNLYESQVGSFERAIKPPITHFREFPHYIDTHLETFKNKQVLMYCTGGVRCERASAYLKHKGVARQVMQITGGIHRYVEQFPHGFFKGKNYVFDKRVTLLVSEDIIGQCSQCRQPYDQYRNCAYQSCTSQILLCPSCAQQKDSYCSSACRMNQTSHNSPQDSYATSANHRKNISGVT